MLTEWWHIVKKYKFLNSNRMMISARQKNKAVSDQRPESDHIWLSQTISKQLRPQLTTFHEEHILNHITDEIEHLTEEEVKDRYNQTAGMDARIQVHAAAMKSIKQYLAECEPIPEHVRNAWESSCANNVQRVLKNIHDNNIQRVRYSTPSMMSLFFCWFGRLLRIVISGSLFPPATTHDNGLNTNHRHLSSTKPLER
jgi:hypothetical protein